MSPIKFQKFAEYLQELEKTSSQNEMVQILAEIFKKSEPAEIDKICYILLGKIAPGYEDIVLGLSEKSVQRAIAMASGASKSEVEDKTRSAGDLGQVASQMIKKTSNPY